MPGIIPKLKRKLRKNDTEERCGLVLSDGSVRAVENTHPNPENGFRIPIEDMRNAGETLAGTWHTHPKTTASLSQEDYLGFSGWPGIVHYIIGTDGIRAYEALDSGLITEIDLAVD